MSRPKRIILTMNSGGKWIPENVRASHIDAARRWNAEYVERRAITASPFCDKALCLRDANADRVCWVDGDAIIRFDCPNPFDFVSDDEFAGVPNYQEDTHDGDPWRYHERDWCWCVDKYKRIDLFYDPARFINGGLIVYTPDLHREIWNEEYPTVPNGEQTLMNFRADMLGLKRRFLPYTFNKVGEIAWRPGPMRFFVQHLACFKFKNESRYREGSMDALRRIDWTKRAPVREAVAA